MAASPDRIGQVVDDYVRLVGTGTADEIVALYAADATVEDPVGTDVRTGPAAIREFYAGLEGLQQETRLITARIAGGEASFHFEIVTRVGDKTYTLSWNHAASSTAIRSNSTPCADSSWTRSSTSARCRPSW